MIPFSVEIPRPIDYCSISLICDNSVPPELMPDNLCDLYRVWATRTTGYSIRRGMIEEIESFRNLGEGWLGPDSRKIPEETSDKVTNVAQTLENVEGLPDPELTPTQNGTISLEWESNRGEAYVEFGKTRISGFLRIEDAPTLYFRDVESIPASFYSEVRDLLYPSAQAHSITTIGTALDGNTIS
jgi:hypothetical protein